MPERRDGRTTLAIGVIASLLTAILASTAPAAAAGEGRASTRRLADHAALAGAGGLAPCAADDLDCRAFTGTLAWRPDEARPLLSSKSLRRLTLLRHKHVRHLVVVEGYFGAIRLHGEHVPAVALMGSSVSNEQVALLQEHCPNLRAVTVMLDGGEAARTAADEVAARLTRRWWVRVADLPEGGQPDTVPETVLEKLLRRARPEAA